MNKLSTSLILIGVITVVGGCLSVAAQSDSATVSRMRVTEEKLVNNVLDFSRTEIFVPATNLADAAEVHLSSSDGDAFLTLTDIRIEGTNMWFRKWEFGRHPPPEGERSPFHMIRSGSVGFETTPEYHLVIGDKVGLRQWNTHVVMKKDGTDIRTCLILRAEKK